MAIVCLMHIGASAQTDEPIKKEVQVVRPYDPTVPDVSKINLQPQIADTTKVKPTFNYTIVPRPLLSTFEPRPIAAAKMVAEPLPELKQWYIRLGFDTHISPLAELYYGSQRDKHWQYGGWVRHKSSLGGVKLLNDERVDAKNSNTEVALAGKYIFDKNLVAANIYYRNRAYRYYGYNYLDTLAKPSSDTQSLNSFGTALEFSSIDTDSSHLCYAAQMVLEHLGDAFAVTENKVGMKANIEKYFRKEQFGGDIAFTRYSRNDQRANTIFTLSPWINLLGPKWRVQVGFSFNLDAHNGKVYQHFYPKAHASYNIVADYVIPYLEIDGRLEENPYAKILTVNPWIMPGLSVNNSSRKMELRGGVKGKFSARVAYNLLASYSIIDSMHFFTNVSVDATNPQANRFGVIYDSNVQLGKVVGELTVAPMDRLDVLVHAEFLRYTLRELEHAWHKPSYLAYANVRYNLRHKIITTLSIDLEGKRMAIDPNGGMPIELDGNLSADLGVEYIYNRRASAFVNLTNITASRNNYWHLYPTHRFTAQVGISYTF